MSKKRNTKTNSNKINNKGQQDKNKKKKDNKFWIRIICIVLVVASLAGIIVPYIVYIFPQGNDEHNHLEVPIDNQENNNISSEPIIYTEEEYEEIKGIDKIALETKIDVPEEWTFSFMNDESTGSQAHYYTLNEYCNIAIERVEGRITEDDVNGYYEDLYESYEKYDEMDTTNIKLETPYIVNNEIRKIDEERYWINIFYKIFQESNSEILDSENNENQQTNAIIEKDMNTIIKIEVGAYNSYILSYNMSHMSNPMSFYELGADKIFDSFVIF